MAGSLEFDKRLAPVCSNVAAMWAKHVDTLDGVMKSNSKKKADEDQGYRNPPRLSPAVVGQQRECGTLYVNTLIPDMPRT